MKQLLSADELIEHMKSKGIKFNEVSEQEAKDFLTYNNYYMKLASYRGNYEKCGDGKRKGQYMNLEFAYLKELSIIDMHLRYIIMQMCLDVEHAVRVKLLRTITSNPEEDGYTIIKKFLEEEENSSALKNIRKHKKGTYCKDLIEKYYPDFPAWVFVELISFGELLKLCAFYEKVYGEKIVNNKLMNVVRDVRNAAAHSNCLINKLSEKLDKSKQPLWEITNFIKGMHDITPKARGKHLNMRFTYSFIALLYVYHEMMPETPKRKRYVQLQEFINDRAIRNKDYFRSNGKICSVYQFHKKVIDNLLK